MTAPEVPVVSAGRPSPLGVTVVGSGATPAGTPAVNVAVWAPGATTVEFCVFGDRGSDAGSVEMRIPLRWRDGGVHHALVEGPRPGTRYGFRVDGAWDPRSGRYANPAKLLIDPYARIVEGPVAWHPLMSGFTGDGAADHRDSAAVVPKCVIADAPGREVPGRKVSGGDVSDREVPDPAANRPRHRREDLVIYEAHLKGISAANPGVPGDLRGTYAGMAHPAVVGHLTGLGVTAVELLPLQTFVDDRYLVNRGMTNYWGYQPVTWFSAEPRYATDGTGVTADRELRHLVHTLHDAGIEVLLDVVYNHSGEGDELGPTLSLRGLDNPGYYRMVDNGSGCAFINDTGTGNTLAVHHLPMLRLVTDSLRHWVTHFGIDGFRFDLGATLGRTADGFDPASAFFQTVAQDPVLSQVHLIAEPWDIGPGGYQLGRFPWPWSEWNDRFRDGIRRLWRGETPGATDVGSLLLGSAEHFDGGPEWRAASSSVNFLTAHDGFTLADVVAYNDRHNEANGENGRDGHGENHSDNMGVEGPTDDPAVQDARARRVRGMLTTLLLAQGTPMLLAGDEMGNSQGGNNNAYVQDNPTGWVDWSGVVDGGGAEGLVDFTRRLIALRRNNRVLRQSAFRHGDLRADGHPDVEWFRADGGPMVHEDWHDPERRLVGVVLRGTAGAPDGDPVPGAVAVVLNPGDDVDVTLPHPGDGADWALELDSGRPEAGTTAGTAAGTAVSPDGNAPGPHDRVVADEEATPSCGTRDSSCPSHAVEGSGSRETEIAPYPVLAQSVVVFSTR